MSDLSGPEITSIVSPRLRQARQLAKRAMRGHARAFLAEGPQAVGEALAGGTTVSQVLITAVARQRHPALVEQARQGGAQIHTVSGEIMAELAQTITPQGVLAVCAFVDVPLARLVTGSPRLLVLLANVRDPGNAGTVLRTADAAGADGVIFCGASVDPYNSKCVRASAGSIFHLPIAVGVPVAEAVTAVRSAGALVLAADGRTGRLLGEMERHLAAPTAWLFGNEAWGLPSDVLRLADDAVAVPIYGRAESLNLAVAAAVCLYASARAQREGGAAQQSGQGAKV